ncbi:MAG TPA: hypothetical protein VMU87_18120 [Stellaceae bacterium]|nr:hypothetical protein [Stellaceae bacterium]
MSDFADHLAAARRLFILRFLAETGGEGNEDVLAGAVRRAVQDAARAAITGDLDHLVAAGALGETWLDRIRVVRLTERGEDCAHGRVVIAGVEHQLWHRR